VKIITATIVLSLSLLAMGAAISGEEEAPTTDQQMTGLMEMCAASADARAERHAEKSLYDRLGGYDKILALTTEIVRLHNENEAIKHMFAKVDSEMLAKHVADFMATGIGGTEEYTGRDITSAHAKFKLTDADFLSAGGDIIQAMQTQEYCQNEIDEVVCILVSMKDQVVLK